MVRRRDAHRLVAALALPLPAGGVPVRAAARGERAARQGAIASSSWSTPASSTATATGRSRPTTRRRRRTTCACASACATPAPRPPSCTCCRRCGFATAGRGTAGVARPAIRATPADVGDSASADRRGRADSAAGGSSPGPDPDGRAPELLFCENETNVAAPLRVARRRRRIPKDGINDHVVSGAATVNPARTRHEDGVLVPRDASRRARPSSCGCAWRATDADARARPRRGLRAHARRARARGRRVLRRAAARGRDATTRPR